MSIHWSTNNNSQHNPTSLRFVTWNGTTHPYVMNTHSTSTNQHDECAIKRISTHASIINLSSRVGERLPCATHIVLCGAVVWFYCEDSDSDSDSSMLVMHVQNKDTVHRRPILLEMKEAGTVGAFWICSCLHGDPISTIY